MRNIRKKRLSRALTLLLILILLLTPAVQALTVEQARELLAGYYVDEIPEQVLSLDSIEDIILALGDPYTQYLNAEEYAAFLASMKDDMVVGIGITAGQHESGLLIMGTFSGAAAQAAGLVAGDIIVLVDGQSAAGQNSDAVAGWVRGQAGTQVSIRVLHVDGSVEEYVLTRQLVVIPATTSELVEDHIGYIVCDTFGDETVEHFQEGIDAYAIQTDHWIVDLRNNYGGDVGAAVGSLAIFLGEGDMVYLRDGAGDYVRYSSDRPSQSMHPVIVLTSQWTASASEIFASAIRDFQGGLIIGSRTFGKGVAQVLLDKGSMPEYFDDGSALKVTAYRYFSTEGNTADQLGVIPHLLVSAENTGNIAWLLSASDPLNENKGMLRVHLGSWRWHVDLTDAVTDELRPAFIELLEALPPETDLFVGGGNNQWNEITVAALADQVKVDYTPRMFADAADSVYQVQIDTLRTYEIVKGCDDGLFHPEETMTRAELCALLAQAMNCTPVSGESMFADVPASAWYAPYVNALDALGLVEGCGDGLFHPLERINHEQFITVMARLSARLNMNFYELSKDGPGEEVLTDQSLSAYSDWAKSSVWLLGKSQKNLFGGELNLLFAPVNELAPADDTLREEAAALLYSVLTYLDILAL